jgi:hypothetical protein
VRSNCTAEFELPDIVNSGSTGEAGCSMIAPIGVLPAEFKTTRCPCSAICLSKTASLIPPPRLVRRSSTSALRSVSIFSAKVGPGWTGVGVGTGLGGKYGVGEALAIVTGGGGLGDAVIVDGRAGGICLPT